MHVQRLRLANDEQVIDWAAQAGIDRAKFTETYRSFGIQARLRRAAGMMDAYDVQYWPLIVVDGKYLTSPSQVGKSMGGGSEAAQQAAALQVMDTLVAKAKAEKAKQ
jgi:thiol:disulfide interchange protein DsbA